MTIVIAAKTKITGSTGRTLDAIAMVSDSRTWNEDTSSCGEPEQKIYSIGNLLVAGSGIRMSISHALNAIAYKTTKFTKKGSENTVNDIASHLSLHLPEYEAELLISGPDDKRDGLFFPVNKTRYPLKLVSYAFDGAPLPHERYATGSGSALANATFNTNRLAGQINERYLSNNPLLTVMVDLYEEAVAAEKDEAVDGNRQWAIQVRDEKGKVINHLLYPSILDFDEGQRMGFFENGACSYQGTPLFFNAEEGDINLFYSLFEERLKKASNFRTDKDILVSAEEYYDCINSLSRLLTIFANGDLKGVYNLMKKEKRISSDFHQPAYMPP